MNTDYTQLIPADLLPIANDICEVLRRNDCLNARGYAAMLLLASILADHGSVGVTEQESIVAETVISMLGEQYSAFPIVLARMARGLAMAHYGMAPKFEANQ